MASKHTRAVTMSLTKVALILEACSSLQHQNIQVTEAGFNGEKGRLVVSGTMTSHKGPRPFKADITSGVEKIAASGEINRSNVIANLIMNSCQPV